MGSWKIMEIFPPRISLISGRDFNKRSSPSKRISPVVWDGGDGFSRMIERAVTLLPEPDSPTNPKVSPFFKLKDTWLTAVKIPFFKTNFVDRSRT
jgi:hypothetical protein